MKLKATAPDQNIHIQPSHPPCHLETNNKGRFLLAESDNNQIHQRAGKHTGSKLLPVRTLSADAFLKDKLLGPQELADFNERAQEDEFPAVTPIKMIFQRMSSDDMHVSVRVPAALQTGRVAPGKFVCFVLQLTL